MRRLGGCQPGREIVSRIEPFLRHLINFKKKSHRYETAWRLSTGLKTALVFTLERHLKMVVTENPEQTNTGRKDSL